MPRNISPAEWKKAVAEQKQRNKQLMEEKEAVTVEEAPALEPTEAPVVETTDNNAEPAEVTQEETAKEEAVVETEDTPNIHEDIEATVIINPTEGTATVIADDGETKEAPETDEATTEEASDTAEMIKSLQDIWSKPSGKKDSKAASSIIYTRIDSNSRKVKPIFQPDLAKFCTSAMISGSIPDTFEIKCTTLTKSNRIGIWEEGGSYLDDGNVLMVTDAYGNPKEAVTAYHDPSVLCGRHALIPIGLYDHLVVGVRNGEKKYIGIYRIDTITPLASNAPAVAVCTKVMSAEPRDEEYDDITIVPNLKEYETGWLRSGEVDSDGETAVSNVLDYILARADATLYNTEASSPIYIKKYSKYRLNTDDYREVVKDADYLNKMIKYDTLQEMYADFEKVSAEYFATHNGKGDEFVGVVTLNPYTLKSGETIVIVYMSGLIYPRGARPRTSPEGRVYYGRTILRENDNETFYYPDTVVADKPESVIAYSTIVERLSRYKMANGMYSSLVTAFKCMC